MSTRFCPDCGAECGQQDQACRECQFPLQIQLVSQAGDLVIEKNQSQRWHRIAQILRRNGIKIETRARKYPARFQLWWALPGLGATIFLVTLLFGGALVDKIWPPPTQSARVLDLNQVNPSAPATNAADATEDATSETNAVDDSDPNLDTSFLRDALGSSDEQKVMTQDLNIDTDEFLDRPSLSRGEIEEIAQRGLLTMTVGDERFRATLLSDDGLVLTDRFSLGGAFQREKRMINTNGELKQTVVFVVPKVGFLNETQYQAEKVMENDALGIALVRAPLGEGPAYDIDFDLDLAVGETIYIASVERGAFTLEERQVVAPIQANADVTVWSLDRSVDPQGAGAPVFNAQGALVGIHVFMNGQEAVLPMLRLRERAPQVYREILD